LNIYKRRQTRYKTVTLAQYDAFRTRVALLIALLGFASIIK